jgi:diguanylate cyclase (GGDEF)-like protein/PAS domain S-box-containing protein
LFRAVCIFGFLVAIFLAARLGVFVPVEQGLAGLRFGAADRAPSGDIVFVEIDGRSLAGVGVWPWPRSVHAALLERLMDAGASDVVFDVDFSAASSPAEDAAFAAALERAGGYAFLAAFRQLSGDQIVWSHPLAAFAQFASAVLVNVEADSSGRLSQVPAALNFAGQAVPSIALTLGRPAQAQPAMIQLDFSIDLAQIRRISAIDVLDNQVDPQALDGKQVVIGASAIELRDFFAVPRFGVIPGPMAQIAAAETVKAGRALRPLDLIPAGLIATLLALLVLWRGASWSPQRQATIAIAAALLAEAFAALALQQWAITFATLPLHASLASFVGVAFLDERAVRYRQHQRVRAQGALMQQVLSQVVTDSFDGILVIDEKGTIVAASDAAASILGVSGILTGRPLRAVLPVQLRQWVERGLMGAHECPCEINSSRRIIEAVATRSKVPAPEPGAPDREVLCITFQDITEERRQAEQLTYLAGHDALTGALSRLAFENHLTTQLEAVGPVTVLLVRMERLRNVSATLGHDFADSVICEVHQRLKALAGAPIGRLGTDLFAFGLPRLMDASELERELSRLSQALEAPYELDDHAVVLGVRFGVSSTLTATRGAPELLQQAEIALRSARDNEAGSFAIYAAKDGENMQARQQLDIAMRRALREQEFFLVYQPQIDLASGAMVGVEALVRWRDPQLGVVSPADFIPLAEETGLIITLGDWVLREACREAASWNWAGRLSVNVSAVQFKLADVVALVEDAIRQSGFPACRLDIEITESLYVGNDGDIITALKQLQAMGVKIAIDDFGTGYSSLSYLAKLPADKIKVDQSFVRSLPEPSSQTIVETIITMAKRLDLAVIAEGVETAAQRDYLHQLGCAVGQGYLFSRPASAEQLGLTTLAIAV